MHSASRRRSAARHAVRLSPLALAVLRRRPVVPVLADVGCFPCCHYDFISLEMSASGAGAGTDSRPKLGFGLMCRCPESPATRSVDTCCPRSLSDTSRREVRETTIVAQTRAALFGNRALIRRRVLSLTRLSVRGLQGRGRRRLTGGFACKSFGHSRRAVSNRPCVTCWSAADVE
jgi:hypothetical protein